MAATMKMMARTAGIMRAWRWLYDEDNDDGDDD
jgi:hypothetical protein